MNIKTKVKISAAECSHFQSDSKGVPGSLKSDKHWILNLHTDQASVYKELRMRMCWFTKH